MKFQIFSKTKIGTFKKTNQDFFIYQKNKFDQNLFVIADGVGSYPKSRSASITACLFLLKSFLDTNFKNFTKNEMESWVKEILQIKIPKELKKISDQVATTISFAILFGKYIYIFHVGNTRIYQKKKNSTPIFQLTHDHNSQNNLKINFNWSNDAVFLKNSLSNVSNCFFDTQILPIEPCWLIFTTDGLHDFVSLPKINEILKKTNLTTEEKIQTLFNHAIFQGSNDDISIFIVKIFE